MSAPCQNLHHAFQATILLHPFFKAALNPANGCKEGVKGVLRLEDEGPEGPEFFEVVLEYLRSHEAYLNHCAFGEDELTNTFQKCKRFVEFCDKYDICEAASAASS